METNCTETNSSCNYLTSMQTTGIETVKFSTGEIIGISLLNGVSSVVGTIGNLLVLAAVANNKNLQTKPDYFIASLACADLLVTVVSQPMFIYHIKFFEETTGKYYGETAFFKIFSLVGHLALLASVSNIFAVTVDRFIATRFPFKYILIVTKRRVLIMITVAWFVSFAISLAYTVYRTMGIEPNKLFLWIYCTLFLVATVIIYAYLLVVARKHEKKVFHLETKGRFTNEASTSSVATQTTNSESEIRPKKESKAAKTIAIVVGVFLLCWLPLIAFSSAEGWRESSAWFIRRFQWFHTISMCNSCFNPYIYCARSKRYRSAYYRCLRCYLCKLNADSNRNASKSNS